MCRTLIFLIFFNSKIYVEVYFVNVVNVVNVNIKLDKKIKLAIGKFIPILYYNLQCSSETNFSILNALSLLFQ